MRTVELLTINISSQMACGQNFFFLDKYLWSELIASIILALFMDEYSNVILFYLFKL